METFPEALAAARLGQSWAFGELHRAYAGKVLGYAAARGASDPEGLTNEVFAQAFTSLGRFVGGEPQFRSWLFTIARRRVIDDHRRAAPAQAEYDPAADPRTVSSAEDDALGLAAHSRVAELLRGLSPDQREVLVLRIVADLTVEQVAAATGKRPGAVKALQRRGLAALEKSLARTGDRRAVPLRAAFPMGSTR